MQRCFSVFSRFTLLCALSLCVALPLLTGCESSDAVGITVTPGEASVRKGSPSVRLSAEGWDNFKWTLEDNSLGTLSSRTGTSVIYTATQFSGASTNENVKQTITVWALGSGGGTESSSASTNTTSSAGMEGYSATVTIYQKN